MTKLKHTPKNSNNNLNTSSLGASPPRTLPEFLDTILDFRRGQGRMHRLPTILLIILMATMSGCFGQRATGDFVVRHRKDLLKLLRPKNNKLPSYQTIARVMQHLDYAQFSSVFFSWAKTVIPIGDKEWMALDGKAIRGTTTDAGSAQQTYTNLVSLFVTKSKLVLTGGKVTNKSNEIPLVIQLVESLGITGIVFTADALHAQRKTVKAVIASGNDYVIGVKGNQKKLYAALKKTPEIPSPATSS